MDEKELSAQSQKDEALFEALQAAKKRKKRKIIITVTSIVGAVVLLGAVCVIALQQKVRQEFATQSGEVLSSEVTTGSIRTTVSGSGKLVDKDLNEVTVPEGVEITEVLAQANTKVEQGDVLATVDMATVKSTMAQLQNEIKDLDDQINEAEADAVSKYVRAGVSGRLVAVFAKKNDAVADVMYENGALALLSLDGYLCVEVNGEGLAVGDKVTVTLSGGKEITGTVEVAGNTATVLVTDNGPDYQEEVTVSKGGTVLGTGKLEVHSPLKVTGFAGTVSAVHEKVGTKVSDSDKLFTLKDTQHSANYDALLRSRSALEETLLELLTIQHDGAVCAPIAGTVSSVDYQDGGTAVATISPDVEMTVTINVDESDILALEVGQTVSSTVSSAGSSNYGGRLTEINKTASDGSYTAVVTLEKQEGMLAGMTASVSVQIEGVENALLIPVEALHETSTGAYVYTGYDEGLQEYTGRTSVVVGIRNSTYVEIKSGLNVGDKVYYTEKTSFNFGSFGGMGGFGGMGSGNMPNMGGGSGGGMPSFGGGSGGGMPNFSGGNMPNMGGGRPSGSGGNRGQ